MTISYDQSLDPLKDLEILKPHIIKKKDSRTENISNRSGEIAVTYNVVCYLVVVVVRISARQPVMRSVRLDPS